MIRSWRCRLHLRAGNSCTRVTPNHERSEGHIFLFQPVYTSLIPSPDPPSLSRSTSSIDRSLHSPRRHLMEQCLFMSWSRPQISHEELNWRSLCGANRPLVLEEQCMYIMSFGGMGR